MGDKTLIYKTKLDAAIKKSAIHLKRLQQAITLLSQNFAFPLSEEAFERIETDATLLAYCDQIIYRFSKLQDTMGAKLFKAILAYEGENTDKPFLDILNELEKMQIIDVEWWFELRDLRNEIAHNYSDEGRVVIDVVNTIYQMQERLKSVLEKISKL